ncbi:MAG: SIMPL domain-containing protein, partial [Gaiellales bacterium]
MSGIRQFLFGAAVAAAIVSTVVVVRSGSGSAGPVQTAQAAQAASVTSPPQQLASYLRFTGTGTVRVKPDTASISFDTSGTNSSKSAATNQASAAMRRVLSAMRAHGIPGSDLQTSMNVYQDTSQGIYQANDDLQVTVHHTVGVGALIAAGLNAGADSSSGPYFSLTDQNTGYDAALRAAMSNARAHADAAAALIGAHVTGVVSIDDTPAQQPEPFYGASLNAVAAGVRGIPV